MTKKLNNREIWHSIANTCVVLVVSHALLRDYDLRCIAATTFPPVVLAFLAENLSAPRTICITRLHKRAKLDIIHLIK